MRRWGLVLCAFYIFLFHASISQAAPKCKNGYCLPLDSWGVTASFYYGAISWDPNNDRFTATGSYHGGTDLQAVKGTPVYAVTKGTVIYSGWEKMKSGDYAPGGRVLTLLGDDGYYYYYAHLSKFVVSADNNNKYVDPGTLIAYSGDSGYGKEDSFDDHLHFSVGTKKNSDVTSEYKQNVYSNGSIGQLNGSYYMERGHNLTSIDPEIYFQKRGLLDETRWSKLRPDPNAPSKIEFYNVSPIPDIEVNTGFNVSGEIRSTHPITKVTFGFWDLSKGIWTMDIEKFIKSRVAAGTEIVTKPFYQRNINIRQYIDPEIYFANLQLGKYRLVIAAIDANNHMNYHISNTFSVTMDGGIHGIEDPAASYIDFPNITIPSKTLSAFRSEEFHISGTITSNYPIKKVEGWFIDANTGRQAPEPPAGFVLLNDTWIDIQSDVEYFLHFKELNVGTWKLVLRATDSMGYSREYYSNAFSIWNDNECSCSESYAGWYQVTSQDGLNINYNVVPHNYTSYKDWMPLWAKVYVSKCSTSSTHCHVNYNGVEGISSRNYLQKLPSYTLTFNDNGGSGGPGSVTVWWGTPEYSTVSVPTRENYIFTGYFTSSSGGTKVYNADGTCTNDGTYWSNGGYMNDSGAAFYAQWTPNNGILDVNGELDMNVSPDLGNYGTFDVYINDVLVADDVNDFYGSYPAGSVYYITDIKANDGYEHMIYVGSDTALQELFGGIKGLIPERSTETISLAFNTIRYGTLEIHGILDNIRSVGVSYYGTFDVYIYDNLVADDVNYFTDSYPDGTEYHIRDIKSNPGYEQPEGIQEWNGSISSAIDNIALVFFHTIIHSVTVTGPDGTVFNGKSILWNNANSCQLRANTVPSTVPQVYNWISSDPDIADVDENGLLTFSKNGTVTITAYILNGSGAGATFTISSFSDNTLQMPSLIRDIDEYAFSSTSVENVIIPETIQTIGNQAFSNNRNLRNVLIYSPNVTIGQNVFQSSPNVMIFGYSGSTVQSYAQQNGIPFQPLESTEFK